MNELTSNDVRTLRNLCVIYAKEMARSNENTVDTGWLAVAEVYYDELERIERLLEKLNRMQDTIDVRVRT